MVLCQVGATDFWSIDPENIGKNARFIGLSWKLTKLVF